MSGCEKMNVQLVGLTDEEYLFLKTEFVKSREDNWKEFFLKVVREWRDHREQPTILKKVA